MQEIPDGWTVFVYTLQVPLTSSSKNCFLPVRFLLLTSRSRLDHHWNLNISMICALQSTYHTWLERGQHWGSSGDDKDSDKHTKTNTRLKTLTEILRRKSSCIYKLSYLGKDNNCHRHNGHLTVVPMAIIIWLRSSCNHQFKICINKNMHFLISWKLVQNLVIGWHHLHWFQSWQPGGVTCIATLPWNALLAIGKG